MQFFFLSNVSNNLFHEGLQLYFSFFLQQHNYEQLRKSLEGEK